MKKMPKKSHPWLGLLVSICLVCGSNNCTVIRVCRCFTNRAHGWWQNDVDPFNFALCLGLWIDQGVLAASQGVGSHLWSFVKRQDHWCVLMSRAFHVTLITMVFINNKIFQDTHKLQWDFAKGNLEINLMHLKHISKPDENAIATQLPNGQTYKHNQRNQDVAMEQH